MKQNLRVIVALLLLIAGSFFALKYLSISEVKLVIYIIIGFALGLLSFLMIGQIEGGNFVFFGIKISKVTGGFAVFFVVVGIFLSIDSQQDKLEIADPKLPETWEGAAGTFEWFNPPLAYAVEEHFKTKVSWFNDSDFKLNIVCILLIQP